MKEMNPIAGHIQAALRSIHDDALTARALRQSGLADGTAFAGSVLRYRANRATLLRLVLDYLGQAEAEIGPTSQA